MHESIKDLQEEKNQLNLMQLGLEQTEEIQANRFQSKKVEIENERRRLDAWEANIKEREDRLKLKGSKIVKKRNKSAGGGN